jgi:hypothetical protein
VYETASVPVSWTPTSASIAQNVRFTRVIPLRRLAARRDRVYGRESDVQFRVEEER